MADGKDIESEIYEDIPDVDPKAKKPDKLSPEARKLIIEAILDGAFLTDAAHYAGVDRNTVYNWMRKGRAQRRGKFHDFVMEIDNARATAKMDASRTIKGAFGRDWKAAAHYLALTDPEHWGDKKKLEVNGNLDSKVTIEYVNNWGTNDVNDADSGKV